MKKYKLYWTLLTINAGLPLDKLVVFILSILYYFQNSKSFRAKALVVFCILFMLAFTSFIVNSDRNILIFYPFLFFFLAVLAGNAEANVKLIQNSLLVSIFWGIFSAILALIGIHTIGSLSLIEKGMPFLFAPVGFSPTVQVYGTLCVCWLIIAMETKQKRGWVFYLVLIASILTFNRATWIFLFLLLTIYHKKYAIGLFFIGAVIVSCIELVQNVLFSISTLSSRGELRAGAELSYWKSNDFFVYLFGKGTHLTSEKIARHTIWGRQYIENGWDFIFHTYGIIGFIVYTCIIISLLYVIWRRGAGKFSILIIYYYFVEQILTNEFLASSFCFFTTIILILSNKNYLSLSSKHILI